MFYIVNGIYYICGSECFIIVEIVYWVVDFLKLDCLLIEFVIIEEMKEVIFCLCFSGLSIEKVKVEIGYILCILEEGMEVFLF